jgi:hypothetical protein
MMRSQDQILDSAIDAMRDMRTPPGPSEKLLARTRQAIRAAERAGQSPPHAQWRWAAAIILAATVAITWAAIRQSMVRSGSRDVAQLASRPVRAEQSPYVSDPPPMLTGLVRIEGHPPELLKSAEVYPLNGCPHHHPPPADESFVVSRQGGLANVVVSVSAGLPADSWYPKPAKPAVLDQKDCRYTPHVLALQVEQELVAKNSDPFLHSVHTNPKDNTPENIAQYSVDPVGRRMKTIKESETFKVTCDLHPWMTAWVAAFDHPYFAVTRADGSFQMPLLPPGTYTLRAWHERLGSVEQQVTLTYDRKLPPVHFKYGPDRVAAAMSDRVVTVKAQ